MGTGPSSLSGGVPAGQPRSILTVKFSLWRWIASSSPSNSPIRTMPLKNGASLS
jgi:hypothetical protein